jgi:hypothetical protein
VVAPWTARNYIVLDRLVPISTGGGKALFIGTYLPGDGDHFETKRALHARFHPRSDLSPEEVDALPMEPLLDRVARRYPDLPRDSALAAEGRENLSRYLSERPLDFVAMIGRKVWRMWSEGSGPAMTGTAASVLHGALVVLGFVGLGALAWRRRFEALALGVVIAGVTAIGAVLLASTRRNLILMPLVIALAATALAWLGALVRERRLRARRGAGEAPGEGYPLARRGAATSSGEPLSR